MAGGLKLKIGSKMKDLTGREIKVNDIISYALTVGRSACIAVYVVREVFEDKIKVTKLDSSYNYLEFLVTTSEGNRIPRKHIKMVNVSKDLSKYDFQYIEMTQEEKLKIDNKTSTLSMPERALIINSETEGLFRER